MNKTYSSEPSFFDNFSDLKTLLNSFGHYTGRYLCTYPSDWVRLVRNHINKLLESGEISDDQKKLAVEYLNLSSQKGALVSKNGPPYSKNKLWIENAIPLLNEGIESILINRNTYNNENERVISIDEFNPPITEGKKISATKEEYLRVCKPLLRSSPEIIIVDPYLNPGNDYVNNVMEKFLKYIARTHECQSMIIWARYKEVIGNSINNKKDYRCRSVSKLKKKLSKIIKLSGIKDEFSLRMILVEDYNREVKDRLHDRNIFSLKGGVEIGQGFQTQKSGRKVKAIPIAEQIHDELLTIFLDGNNDLTIKNTINCIGSKCFLIENDKTGHG